MSFDLNFGREDGSSPAINELKEYFQGLSSFKINEGSSGAQFWYKNDLTGVYCGFSLEAPEDIDANLSRLSHTGLSFNLNYIRPSFFAYETMPLVQGFCEHFKVLVEDIQEEIVEHAEASRLIESWRRHNTWAVNAVSKDKEIEMRYLPEEQATAWWQYTSNKQMIQDAMEDDIFVPTIMILEGPAKQLFRMIIWPEAIPQFFPICDYVLIQRKKKRFFTTVDESGVVAYAEVMGQISSYLADYATSDQALRFLPVDKAQEVTAIHRNLGLTPIDPSKHTILCSGDYHDVLLI